MSDVFIKFFLLGLVSFGGPAAHIGYFKRRFVNELNWLDMTAFGGLVALSQVIPGPGSSQIGFAIGYHRAGLLGGLAAFIGFTLPSFTLLLLLALGSANWLGESWFNGLIHGLKLMAVVVVFDAVLSMYNQFCTKSIAKILMLTSAVVTLLVGNIWGQLLILVVAAGIGIFCLAPKSLNGGSDGRGNLSFTLVNVKWLALFGTLFITALVLLNSQHPLGQIFAQFYQAGALVFGGGHVVLPLLEMSVGQHIGSERFLTGYALAQAVPGPMFTLAAFLGAEVFSAKPVIGALVATLAIFLPGFLLLLSALTVWQGLMHRSQFRGAIAGINAAVVGLLLAALVSPVIASAIYSLVDLILVLLGFWLFKRFRLNILWLVLGYVVVGLALGFTG
ncbi:chromate efflux transporter [Shewanella colwelliana]|uniref:chromate efflux transporter n=1 Tax=Shewanella colwelliana TaxID=23 RepID=UPI00299ECA0E|nr:chromate efflux transporter [Shewanella colwelliana]MDX1279688.1 chromate efflux transporter [Shewanella colwelliana]